MTRRSTPNSRRYLWLSVLAVVAAVQILELLLLQRKYDLFTGGFLQLYSYQSLTERALFIGLSLWMDLVFFAAIALIWFRLARSLRSSPAVAAYNYLFLSLAGMGMWLAIKFKVLAYFNDTLNFLIIKNLGGGSLTEAFKYIADEAVIFGLGALLLGLTYWIGLKWVKKHLAVGEQVTGRDGGARGAAITAVVVVLATAILVAWISSEPQLRYGLKKKTSYALISRALDALSDVDRDGYGLFRFPSDYDNLNASLYPGALDVPGNGIDEDGYGGDFTWKGPDPDPLASLTPFPGKHILLIVLESARGDLVGKRWKDKLVAPTMTKLAEEGTQVVYAYSHTGYTTSSIKAILNRSLFNHGDKIKLTDFLEQSGYTLSFLSGQDESFGDVADTTGMTKPGRYFFDARSALEDRVYPSKDPGSLRLSEERVVEQFRVRSEELDWSRPNFFYINLQAAHFPYSHPKMPAITNDRPIARSDISHENREALQATYWNAIAVADQAIGSVIELLKERGVYEDTLIVILGDHGESLFDDDFLGHGHALNKIQTGIPLIINQTGLGIEQAVGQLDVAELVATVASGRFDPIHWKNKKKPQFQLIGSLDKPALIGTVSHGDVRTILDLRTRKVFFSDLQTWKSFDEAVTDTELGHRTRELIDAWERLRWQKHLARQKRRVQRALSNAG